MGDQPGKKLAEECDDKVAGVLPSPLDYGELWYHHYQVFRWPPCLFHRSISFPFAIRRVRKVFASLFHRLAVKEILMTTLVGKGTAVVISSYQAFVA